MDIWVHRARTARDIAWLIPPVLYVSGFGVWAMHASAAGIGFVALTIQQYLSAGAGFLLFLAAVFAASLVAELVRKTPKWRALKDRNPFGATALLRGLDILVLPIGVMLWGLFGSFMQMVHSNGWTMPLSGLLLGLSLVVVELIFWFSSSSDPEGDEEPDDDFEGKEEAEGHTGDGIDFGAWIPTAITLTVVALPLYGIVVLPDVDSSFGGAHDRTAWLELDGSRLSPSIIEALANVSTFDNGTVTTEKVHVLHHDANAWLVRLVREGRTGGNLYELSGEVVLAVHWANR